MVFFISYRVLMQYMSLGSLEQKMERATRFCVALEMCDQ